LITSCFCSSYELLRMEPWASEELYAYNRDASSGLIVRSFFELTGFIKLLEMLPTLCPSDEIISRRSSCMLLCSNLLLGLESIE